MKVGFLIGRLARGGAERQLMRLASGLAGRGHRVEVLCYGGSSPLDAELERSGVRVRSAAHRGQLEKVRVARQWMNSFRPDVAHGFMKRASNVAIAARIVGSRCAVVASDLSTATYARRQPALWASLVMFRFADRVVTQTELNRRSLETLAPWLRGRTVVIRNGLDLARFTPGNGAPHGGPFRFCVVGSVYRVKNPVRVVRAAAALKCRTPGDFRVDWYGRLGLGGDHDPSPEYRQAVQVARELGVAEVVRFHGETADIERAYRSADALIHASLQEGFPNAVVEGMACGLPLVVSRVSDLPLVVQVADNGFVCDETDPASIASAMERMMNLEGAARRDMGLRSRELAARWFAHDRFLDEYESLYGELRAGRR